MIKPVWWAKSATPAAFQVHICVVLSAGQICSWEETDRSTAGEWHHSAGHLPIGEGTRDGGTGSPEKTLALVPVAHRVCG